MSATHQGEVVGQVDDQSMVVAGHLELRGDGPHEAGGLHQRQVEIDGARLGAGGQEDLLDQQAELLGRLHDGVERHRAALGRRLVDVAAQPLGVALDDGQRCLELVAGGGHEHRLGRIQGLLAADVVDGHDLALVERRGGELHPAAVAQVVLARLARASEGQRERPADGVHGGDPGERRRRGVPGGDQAVGVEHGHTVGDAVDHAGVVGLGPDQVVERHRVGDGHTAAAGEEVEQLRLRRVHVVVDLLVRGRRARPPAGRGRGPR